jgi:adenine-specific DNA-methyltransferase
MTTVFVGGSREIARLPGAVLERLDNVIGNGHDIVVGDAAGADRAVQQHMLDVRYEKLTVFCSGSRARHNLGGWPVRSIVPPDAAKGFQFYAAKDRAMAAAADFGLMIWDGKSPGTVLNVLRLIRGGKFSVLMNLPAKTVVTVKSAVQWDAFLAGCSVGLRASLRERATADEWGEAVDAALPM